MKTNQETFRIQIKTIYKKYDGIKYFCNWKYIDNYHTYHLWESEKHPSYKHFMKANKS